jgi:hypothetical protein
LRSARGWVLAALAAILIAAAAYAAQPSSDSPEHSSNSDAANGTSAARLFAEAMGHPVSQIAGTFTLPAPFGMMFVFTPTSAYTSDEAQRTLQWVRSGGILVYASEHGDAELDQALGVIRLSGVAVVTTEVGNPVVEGVNRVSGAGLVTPFDASSNQAPVLRTQSGRVTGYLQRIGLGRVMVMADPLVLCNGYLDKVDNGRLLADLLGIADPGAEVGFDEYHHGLVLSDYGPQAWVKTPWGAALLWMLIAIFTGLVLRGRSFGPLIPRPPEAARSDVEWSVAVGQLLRRSRARALTLGLLTAATERAVASRTGLPLQPRERFWNALRMRAPAVAEELAESEKALQSPLVSDRDLLAAARRLHHVAYPVTEESGHTKAAEEPR